MAKAKSTFGPILRELREKRDLTQAELAARSGVNRVQIARIETGVSGPSWETAMKLARALDVPCQAFDDQAKAGAK